MALDKLPDPTVLAVPAFVLFVLAEMLYGWKTGKVKFEGRDTLTSLLMGLGNTSLWLGTLAFSMFYVWDNYRLFDLGTNLWVFAFAFVVDDYKYYWLHRFGHRIRWMWAAHVIHHSSQHYNLSTALRQTWTGRWTPGFLLAIPLVILGIHPEIILFVGGLNLIYQFWIHTEAIDKMPKWFEAIMNTPSHHRVHHGKNPRYLDANYAGVFILWDKIHGSFVPEIESEPVEYGLVQDLGTFNPLRVAFHEWIGIIQDMWSAKGLKNKLMFLVGPPGWTPDGSRKTSEMIKAEWADAHEASYDQNPPMKDPAE
ncbi:sterol desaturase family protein [Temperatibacter marinus]|uniref:Sterol desaturase family protein n=1 Tax=Temperatibacter marinus TaxID=1456591 RepID=A0AA52EGX1_9PROT|nr:sterol desaturase family protein [Temperatibacter marinus]WND02299.1 sterol desaturase family protein [Temperatibacter marinus]